MRIIKENLFLAVTIAITLVGLVYLFIVGASPKGEYLAEAQKRIAFSKDIARMRGYSQEQLDTLATQRVKVENDSDQARKLVYDYSNQYPVVKVKINRTGKLIPLWPWPKEDWGLKAKADRKMEKVFSQLRGKMAVADLPSPEAIADETERRASKGMRQYEIEQAKIKAAADAAKAPDGTTPSNREPIGGTGLILPIPGNTGRITRRTPGGNVAKAETEIRQKAYRDALAHLAKLCSKKGVIYIDENAFALEKSSSSKGKTSIGATDGVPMAITKNGLWKSQVRLWVMNDIIAAIKSTNASIKLDRNVANAPIKRLQSIDVAGDFYTGSDAKSARDAHPEESTGLMLGYGSRRGTKTSTTLAELPKALTLTESVSNKNYDLVRYSFTVVMRTKSLELLEHNLCKSNLHTILSVAMAKPGNPEPTGHYYGVQGVMVVRISGQLKLLTSWVRGTFECANGKITTVTVEPLVPAGILKSSLPAALRKCDQVRIKNAEATGLDK